MIKKKQLTLIISICVICVIGTAQSKIQFENIGVQQGLSATNVNQIIQDHNGFLWIATTNGLSRYDGIAFKVFRHDKNNPNSLSDNNIRCLLQDSKQKLWVGTLNSGLNRYDFQTGQFKRFLHRKDDTTSISNNDILSIYEDSQQRLWIGTEMGLNLFDSETETFTTFLPNDNDPNSLKAKAVLTIQEDSRGWLWVGTWDGGLNLVIPTKNPKLFRFRHFLQGKKDTDLKSNHIWKIFLTREQQLWLGTYGGGVSIMLPNTNTNIQTFQPQFQTILTHADVAQTPLANNLVFGLNQDFDGRIWVSTVDGLTLITPKTTIENGQTKIDIGKPEHFQNIFSNPRSLIHNEMRDIFVDNLGTVWCSTVGGISKFDKKNVQFDHFLNIGTKPKSIPTFALQVYDENTIYIGSRAEFGLIEYHPNTQSIRSYYAPIDQSNKPINSITEFISFYKKNADSLWIGTRTGIYYFNPKTKQFVNYPINTINGKSLTNLHIRKIYPAKAQYLWLATGAGLVLFNSQTGTFQFFLKDKQGNTLPNNDIMDIAQDEKNQLWLATYEGLSRLDFQKDGSFIFKTYLHDTNDPKSICSNRITNLTILNQQLWIGTENGLAQYREQTDDFKNLTSVDGLRNPFIQSMLASDDSTLWLGTRQGLMHINPKTLDIMHYNQQDGIQTGAFATNAAFKDNDGHLFFGGMNGYIRFLNRDIQTNDYAPPVFISDFKIFNQSPDFNKDITALKTIQLRPHQNYFTISFSALNFTQSYDNQFAYQLEGFHDDWIYCGHKNSVSFSNLDGGNYIFRVKAANNDGIWNETGTSMKIIVIPPIWQRNWFRFFLTLTIVVFAALFYFNRVNRIKKQQALLQQQVQERTQEIRQQKNQIEHLVQELTLQNEKLEATVKERTATINRSNLELKRSNQDLEQFAYVASHDLQEPLRTIGNFTQLLARRYNKQLDKNGKEYIQFIVDGVKRMSSLIQSLLNYSRVGRSDISFTTVDLNRVVQNKIIDLSIKIEEKNAIVNIEELPTNISCEANQIGIVFYNLINNGLKFNTKPNPTITVRLEEENDEYWKFSVADNGIGIPPEYQDKIFEIFKRLHQRDEFEGNGIGLALCKRIILRHEGDIWLKSVVGEGTTFYFTVSKSIHS